MLTSILKTITQMLVLAVIFDLLGKYFMKKTLVGKLLCLAFKDIKFMLRQVLKLTKSVYRFIRDELKKDVESTGDKDKEKEETYEENENEKSTVIEFSRYYKK